MIRSTEKETWQGRVDDPNDSEATRFHQVVKSMHVDDLSNDSKAFGVVGFAGDEGVRRNQGRQGAAEGPKAIRKNLANLAYHLEQTTLTADIGDVVCEGTQMETAQAELGVKVAQTLRQRVTPIILGGGHETLYGHYLGVRDYLGPDARLGIINIDAHFDMRADPTPSSGTMFRQIMERDDKTGYLCLGIQPLGNTQALFSAAKQYGVQYVLESEIDPYRLQDIFDRIDAFCKQFDYVMMTLCTDSIMSSAAPGVSAPAPLGLDPKIVSRLLKFSARQPNLLSFDISEVNPLVDEGGKTARLAAYLVAETMQAFHQS